MSSEYCLTCSVTSANCHSLHKLLLDELGIKQVAAVIGGSMGGMLVLEWAYFGKDYVRCIVPIATSSRHSAWGISWGEAQRQSIYADPKYDDGYYTFDDPPSAGLGAARMSALLTYRSRNSFESRFGRNIPDASKKQTISENQRPPTASEDHWAIHNDGHKPTRPIGSRLGSSAPTPPREISPTPTNKSNAVSIAASIVASQTYTAASSLSSSDKPCADSSAFADPQFHGATINLPPSPPSRQRGGTSYYYSAQSYLRYQGSKFVKRFDSNCYIAITRKLDTHDVSRGRTDSSQDPITAALAMIEQPTLVLGIESDGLFTFAEQEEIARGIPNARLEKIESPEGHDAFLLQFEQVNRHILGFLEEVLPDVMGRPGDDGIVAEDGVGAITKTSTFGEAEVEDITAW